MRCKYCRDTGLIGPDDDQFVCRFCPSGAENEKHYRFNHGKQTYELDVESYVTDPDIQGID